MAKINARKLFVEGFLIVFSVLFALVLSQVWEDHKRQNQTNEALAKIDQEIETNKKVIDRWVNKHQRLVDRLDSLTSGLNPGLKNEFSEGEFFGLGPLLQGESFIDALITQTAWDAAKSTQIISEFEYADVEEFTLVYGLQDIVLNQTVQKFLDEIFSRESQDLKNLNATLNQLNILMNELIGQERLLAALYQQRLDSKTN